VAKVLMPTSNLQIFKKYKGHQDGFSLIEILVALTLGALIFLAMPSSDNVQKHRDLQTAVEDLDRSVRFASNEAILRNTVVRLRISLDKTPVVYTVEYGPPGNLPLPEMETEKANLSLEEEKSRSEKSAALDRQFTKVEEFEEIKREIHPDVTVIGIASSSQKNFINEGEASIYFYPTGEKDGALVFFNTSEEFAFIEVEAFMSDTKVEYEPLKKERVAKLEDIVQTRVDEVYKEWMTK
jgi:prepilin-type N-terminal cleavage/methylation domain-containing protein